MAALAQLVRPPCAWMPSRCRDCTSHRFGCQYLARVLATQAHGNRENQDLIAKMGGVRPIVALLDTTHADYVQASSAGGRAPCLPCLCVEASPRTQHVKMNMGCIHIHAMAAQAQAAFALMEISRGNAINQKAIVNLGGIPHLANLMKTSHSAEVKAEVAGALWSLSEASDIKVAIAQVCFLSTSDTYAATLAHLFAVT